MCASYISETPSRKEARYDFLTGDYDDVRFHVFTMHDGREVLCDPKRCREHWREKHWNRVGEVVA